MRQQNRETFHFKSKFFDSTNPSFKFNKGDRDSQTFFFVKLSFP